MYPHAKVVTVIPIFFILQMMVLPAPIFLGIWFVIQLVRGSFSMGSAQAAGVAWWAHAGGFLFGFVVAWFLGKQQQPPRPRVRVINPQKF
ncbi:MAG: rhomboid family intramembrane serine protease [Fuerstiella sp.]|nr:rhomboid family intramembrane serine protease [Fuerstiella sp.]